MQSDGAFTLDLIGSFRLTAPNGKRIAISAKRSRILLAMLATSRSGERSRRWLQERIWGSRERANSQASLRRELCNLRPLVDGLLIVDHETVALDLDRIVIDARDPARVAATRDEFLEGIDIAWEEGFEDWLREERQAIDGMREAGPPAAHPQLAAHAPTLTGPRSLAIVVQEDIPGGARSLGRLMMVLAECVACLRGVDLVGAPVTIASDEAANLPAGLDYALQCRIDATGRLTLRLHGMAGDRTLWRSHYDLDRDPAHSLEIVADTVSAISAQIDTAHSEAMTGRHASITPDWQRRPQLQSIAEGR